MHAKGKRGKKKEKNTHVGSGVPRLHITNETYSVVHSLILSLTCKHRPYLWTFVPLKLLFYDLPVPYHIIQQRFQSHSSCVGGSALYHLSVMDFLFSSHTVSSVK